MEPNQPVNPQQSVKPEIPQNSKFSFVKYVKLWQIAVLFILLIPTTAYFLGRNQTTKQIPTVSTSPTPAANLSILTPLEKSQIDTWITNNTLNTYGDPVDTAYPGGTPLFNEATGKTTDRYDYIAQQHPSRPWCTPRPACLDATPKCLIAETPQMCPIRETADPTADWKTYENPSYGPFTFKYPPESQISEEKPATIVTLIYPKTAGTKFTMEFYMLAENAEEFNSSKSNLAQKHSISDVAINGYKGYSYSDSSAGTDEKNIFLDNGQGKYVNIITNIQPSNSTYLKINERILSTFKFTNQTTFEIKELGIKINLVDEIRDLGYVYKNSIPYFYTNYLITQAKEKGGINNCTKEIGPIGAFSKIDKSTLKDDPNGPWDETIQGIRAETVGKNGNLPLAKEFPNFFLFFSHPNNVCSNDQSIQKLQENQINILQESMQTAELTQ